MSHNQPDGNGQHSCRPSLLDAPENQHAASEATALQEWGTRPHLPEPCHLNGRATFEEDTLSPPAISTGGQCDPNDPELERRALAILLRCPELQRDVLGDNCPVSLSEVLAAPLHQAIFDAAAHLYRRDQSVPDSPGALCVEVERYLRTTDNGVVTASHLIVDAVQWCYGDAPGSISAAAGRELWCDLVRDRQLVNRLRTLAVNARSSPATMELNWSGVSRIVEWLQALSRGQATRRLRGYSMAELFEAAQPPRWRVEQVLVPNINAFIGGPFKSLKSGIALDLLVSLAIPEASCVPVRFLNRFACEPARHVLAFTGEANEWEVRQRIERIYASKSIFPLGSNARRDRPSARPTDDLNATIYFEAPQMADAQVRRNITEEIRRHDADVVIFDPLYLCALGGGDIDAANVFEMGKVLQEMEQVVRDAGADPIFLHHFTKKVKPGATPTLGDLAFAGSAERAAQWILLNHRVPFDSAAGCARLIMEVGGRAGQCGSYGADIVEGRTNNDFTGRQWNVLVTSLEEAQERDQQAGFGRRSGGHENAIRREHDDQLAAERICAHLREHPEGDSLSRIRAATNVGLPRANRVIEQLATAGQIVNCRVRRDDREVPGYRLADSASRESRD